MELTSRLAPDPVLPSSPPVPTACCAAADTADNVRIKPKSSRISVSFEEARDGVVPQLRSSLVWS